jgi:hypothetical protein
MTGPAVEIAELYTLADAATAAREAWRTQAVEVRCMGDDNGGWGTDAEYRAAVRVRAQLWLAYEQAWATFACALNVAVGNDVLDPEQAA